MPNAAITNAELVDPECPKCGGAMYDNRLDNQKRRANDEPVRPDFRCKDRESCDGAIWPPKGAANTNKGGGRAKTPPEKKGYNSGPALPGESPEQAQPGPVPPAAPAAPRDGVAELNTVFRLRSRILSHALNIELPHLKKAAGVKPDAPAPLELLAILMTGVATTFIAADKRRIVIPPAPPED